MLHFEKFCFDVKDRQQQFFFFLKGKAEPNVTQDCELKWAEKNNNLLGIFYLSDGCFDVTFLLVQQAQLKHGKWHQVGVMLDIIFTAKKSIN